MNTTDKELFSEYNSIVRELEITSSGELHGKLMERKANIKEQLTKRGYKMDGPNIHSFSDPVMGQTISVTNNDTEVIDDDFDRETPFEDEGASDDDFID